MKILKFYFLSVLWAFGNKFESVLNENKITLIGFMEKRMDFRSNYFEKQGMKILGFVW